MHLRPLMQFFPIRIQRIFLHRTKTKRFCAVGSLKGENMNIGSSQINRATRTLLSVGFISTLLLAGCAGVQQRAEDPLKEPNLSKTPIGLHVEKVGYSAGMTYVDITVRNNSGKFINMLYIEVYPYNNDSRVGMKNNIFNSVNVGETMVVRKPIDSSGRSWNGWRFSYRIQ